ncbi:hypothetical protein C8R45DRAFT_991349 [Mycena sanguinolenta]|nr:hypothetical protein C8R45DRAFT_991349 [Mycena sanguinolenta]
MKGSRRGKDESKGGVQVGSKRRDTPLSTRCTIKSTRIRKAAPEEGARDAIRPKKTGKARKGTKANRIEAEEGKHARPTRHNELWLGRNMPFSLVQPVVPLSWRGGRGRVGIFSWCWMFNEEPHVENCSCRHSRYGRAWRRGQGGMCVVLAVPSPPSCICALDGLPGSNSSHSVGDAANSSSALGTSRPAPLILCGSRSRS